MYAYIIGEEGHFCFTRKNTRAEAEGWLELEVMLYRSAYESEPECGVLTNKQFDQKFDLSKHSYTHLSKRYGETLRKRIEEVKNMR